MSLRVGPRPANRSAVALHILEPRFQCREHRAHALGVLVGEVVARLVVCWPVSWDVVFAVDIGFL